METTSFTISKSLIVWTTLSIIALIYNIVLCEIILVGLNVIYVELIKKFDVTRTEASFLVSAFMVVRTLTCVANSYITRRYGVGKCMLLAALSGCLGFVIASFATNLVMVIASMAALSGCAHGILYLGSYIASTKVLSSDKRRRLLTITMTMFAGIGSSTASPIMTYLFENYGYRTAMLTLGGFFLWSAICNMAIYIQLRKKHKGEEKVTHGTWKLFIYLLKNPTFMVYMSVEFVRVLLVALFRLFQVDNVISVGFDIDTATFFAALYGFSALVGRVINGLVLSLKKWHGFYQYGFVFTLFGGMLLVLSFMTSYNGLLVSSCALGFLGGPMAEFTMPLLYEFVKVEAYGVALSMQLCIVGTSTTTISPIAGKIRDLTGSYSLLFSLGLPVAATASAVLCTYQLIRKCRAEKSPPSDTDVVAAAVEKTGEEKPIDRVRQRRPSIAVIFVGSDGLPRTEEKEIERRNSIVDENIT